MSVGSLGAVDYRSDKERTARYAKQTRDAVRQGNAYQRGQDAQAAWHAQMAQWNANAAAGLPPVFTPGWYLDEHDPRFIRWWDATGPSQHIQPIPAGQPPQPTTMADELARLAELHRGGMLSDDEFAAAKARLLG